MAKSGQAAGTSPEYLVLRHARVLAAPRPRAVPARDQIRIEPGGMRPCSSGQRSFPPCLATTELNHSPTSATRWYMGPFDLVPNLLGLACNRAPNRLPQRRKPLIFLWLRRRRYAAAL